MEHKLKPVDLYYEETGQGMPLILVHGFPMDHTTWQPVLPFLNDCARIILPDLRGFGKSPVSKGTYTMRLLAEDILRLMDLLKLEKAVIAGHSMGGYVALILCTGLPTSTGRAGSGGLAS